MLHLKTVKENINRILVKTPNEKLILRNLKKEVSNPSFSVVLKDFRQLKNTLYEKSIPHSI